jgi:V8-like Glu-specific endopeptidase
VAPDLVLTAAHCVPRNDPTPAQLAERKFVAGWNRGEYAAVRSFAAVYVHPENIPGPVNTRTIYTDVALVRLDEPIPESIVAPMRLGALPGPDKTIGFVGYRNDRRHAPTLSTGCDYIVPRPHLLFLSCPVVSGNSGGPLLAGPLDDPHVVGVVSAKGAGGAFAAGLQEWMEAYLPADW